VFNVQVGIDQKAFDKEESDSMKGGPYSVLEECALMCPMERDCGGKVPQVLADYEKGGLRMVPREERAEKLGIEVKTHEAMDLPPDPVKVEGEKYHIPPRNPAVYTVGSADEILECLAGINNTKLLEDEEPKGADLVVYTALPATAEDDVDGKWTLALEEGNMIPVADRTKVVETMKLAAELVAQNGVVLAIAPLGTPAHWFSTAAKNAVRRFGIVERQEGEGREEGREKVMGGDAKEKTVSEQADSAVKEKEKEKGKEEKRKGEPFTRIGTCALHVIKTEQVSQNSR
jgi:hypothetical protein